MRGMDKLEYCIRWKRDDLEKNIHRVFVRRQRDAENQVMHDMDEREERRQLDDAHHYLKNNMTPVIHEAKILGALRHPDLMILIDIDKEPHLIKWLEELGVNASIAPVSSVWKAQMEDPRGVGCKDI